MKRRAIVVGVIFVALIGIAFVPNKLQKQRWLIFEATILKIGKAPSIACGAGTTPSRLAKYKIDRIYVGSYDKDEIIVHHLFCREDVLSDLKEGDKVLVVIDLHSPPFQISPDEDILRSEDVKNVKELYSAKRVAKVTSCCDF